MPRAGLLLAALAALSALPAAGCARGPAAAPGAETGGRKLVVVLFGGGTRSAETVDDPEHRHIPRLWNELVPRGTLFTNARVEGKVVHPNSAGSIVTGHWEWADLDWSRPVAHPTVFEICRMARNAPDTKAWAFVYASILANIGGSGTLRKTDDRPNVVEPPTIPRSTAEKMDELMRGAAASGRPGAEVAAAAECARLARSTGRVNLAGLRSDAARSFVEREFAAWQKGSGSTSHDQFLTDRATACMKQFAPEVLLVAYGEIDCAHYGSWSRYAEAIRRTDELTYRLWRAAEELPAYRGKTLFIILPDHGRELDRPGGAGFIHHSDFYTDEGADEGCRRVFMLLVGPGVAAGRKTDRPVPITSVAATGLEYLGLEPSANAAPSLLPLAGEGKSEAK